MPKQQHKTAKQLVKNIFAEFQKKKRICVSRSTKGHRHVEQQWGVALTCPLIGVPQIGVQQIDVQQIDVQQIDVLMTVFLGRYDQQRIWSRISR
jgi:hypothetical protein